MESIQLNDKRSFPTQIVTTKQKRSAKLQQYAAEIKYTYSTTSGTNGDAVLCL